MLTRSEACRISQILDAICEPRRRVTPGYGRAEVLKSIFIMNREPIGRQKLSKILGIGEASVRTMLKRLREHDLVSVDLVAGAELSDKGRGLFAPLLVGTKIFSIESIRGLEDWGPIVLLAAKNMGVLLNTYGVLKIRDVIISSGAEAAIVGVYNDDHVFSAPGIDMKELNRSVELILDRMNVLGGSLVIIIKDRGDAAYESLSRLLELMCSSTAENSGW